jgi:hypothetical protein
LSRLSIALAAYVLLGVLAWLTISDQKFRLVTLVILGAFALRTLVHRHHQMHAATDRDPGTSGNSPPTP